MKSHEISVVHPPHGTASCAKLSKSPAARVISARVVEASGFKYIYIYVCVCVLFICSIHLVS